LTTVTTLATQNQATAETLRNQVAQTAETLRNQVATTQLASQNTFNATVTDFNKRISQLELSLSAGGGKSEGMEKFIGWIFGLVGIGIAAAMYMK
jgi:hypothetical protein